MTKNDPPGDIDHFLDHEFKTDTQRNKLYVLYHYMTLIHFIPETYHCVFEPAYLYSILDKVVAIAFAGIFYWTSSSKEDFQDRLCPKRKLKVIYRLPPVYGSSDNPFPNCLYLPFYITSTTPILNAFTVQEFHNSAVACSIRNLIFVRRLH